MISIKEANIETWNEQLEYYQYSLFQIREWIESVAYKNNQPVFLDFYYNDKIIGKISGLITRDKPYLGKLLYFYSGPAIIKNEDNPDYYNMCIDALIPYAKKKKCSRVNIHLLDSKWRILPSSKNYKIFNWVEYVVDLSTGVDNFNPRNNIKKKIKAAQAANTKFHASFSPDLLPLLFKFINLTKLRRENKSRKSYNPINIRLLNNNSLLHLIKTQKAIFHYSKNNGDIHYISLDLFHNGKLYGLFNGADEFAYKNGIPAFTIANMIQEKVEYLNMGAGITEKEDASNIASFKKNMGAKPLPVFILKSEFLLYPQKAINSLTKIIKYIPSSALRYKLKYIINKIFLVP